MASIRMVSAAVALLTIVGAAQGAFIKTPTTGPALSAATKGVAGENPYFRSGFVTPFNVGGIGSHDGQGAAGNQIRTMNFPAGTSVTGVSWDVVLTAFQTVGTFGGSWRSELSVAFTDSAGGQGIFLAPGTDDSSGGPTLYSSGGVVKFSDVAIPNILLADGVLRMEFFEGFDDQVGVDDGIWNSGSLGIQTTAVPAPAAMGLFGVAGLMAARRRRA